MPDAPRSPAVVVVTWRGGDWLARCVQALKPQLSHPDQLCIVAARPDPLEIPEGVTTLRSPEPVGYAAAANLGFTHYAGQDVILLNDDTRPAPSFVAALAQAAHSFGPGIYQPRIVLAGSAPQHIDNTGHRLFFDGFNVARERGLPAVASQAPACGEVGAFSGAAALLTRDVLAATGGFDGSFGAFGEDLDLSLRARRLGFRIRFVDEAQIEHALDHSYGRGDRRKVFLVERNRVQAAVRSLPWSMVLTMPLWTTLRIGALTAASTAGRGIGAAAAPGASIAVLAGGVAGVLRLPRALRKRRGDQQMWTTSDRELWAHVLRHHARPSDLLRRPAPQ